MFRTNILNTFDFQSGHTKGLFIFRLYHEHGLKMRDEFIGIYHSVFEDYKLLSDLVNFRTTNLDFFQVLLSQNIIKTF